MKLIYILSALVLLVATTGWFMSHHYLFVVTDAGNTVYRCNYFTGKAEFATPQGREWVPIIESKDHPQ